MVITQSKWTKDFFIKFSSLSVKQNVLVESLLREGMRACFSRDKTRQFEIGEWLCDLSPRFEYIGRWHLALSAPTENWSYGDSGLRQELESISEKASPYVRALSLYSLAGLDIRANSASEITFSNLKDSINFSLKSGNILGYLQAHRNLSLLYSINGENEKSLSVLRGIQPIVDRLGSQYDVLKLEIYNDIAYDLLQTENIKAAAYFIQPVIKSPYLLAYPEWQETALEINESLRSINHSQIFVPYRKPENLVDNSEFEAARAVKASTQEHPVREENYKYPCIVTLINDDKYAIAHLSENRVTASKLMAFYGLNLDVLTSRWTDKGTLTLKSFFCHEKEVKLIGEEKILPDHLPFLSRLLRDVSTLPESLFIDSIDNKRATPEEIEAILDYVKPMLGNSN